MQSEPTARVVLVHVVPSAGIPRAVCIMIDIFIGSGTGDRSYDIVFARRVRVRTFVVVVFITFIT